jgi:hypothetical protein
MSNDLTQPPCSYCGSPTEPVRQKKLENTKHFYCSDPCQKKNVKLLTYSDRLYALDLEARKYVKDKLKTAIDMIYTAECLSIQDCVILFTDSNSSFKLSGDIRKDYNKLLETKGRELLEEQESLLNIDKIRIIKNV